MASPATRPRPSTTAPRLLGHRDHPLRWGIHRRCCTRCRAGPEVGGSRCATNSLLWPTETSSTPPPARSWSTGSPGWSGRPPAGLLPRVVFLCQGRIAPQFSGVELGLAERRPAGAW